MILFPKLCCIESFPYIGQNPRGVFKFQIKLLKYNEMIAALTYLKRLQETSTPVYNKPRTDRAQLTIKAYSMVSRQMTAVQTNVIGPYLPVFYWSIFANFKCYWVIFFTSIKNFTIIYTDYMVEQLEQ